MFKRITSILPFQTSDDPLVIIDEIEEILLEEARKRASVRRQLKQELRKEALARKQAEQRLQHASDENIALERQSVDAHDELVDEYRERVSALNDQINAIRKRLPKLEMARQDIKLKRSLGDEAAWENRVAQLEQELGVDEPVDEAGPSVQLQALLGAVDRFSNGVQQTQSPTVSFTDVFEEEISEPDEEHDEGEEESSSRVS